MGCHARVRAGNGLRWLYAASQHPVVETAPGYAEPFAGLSAANECHRCMLVPFRHLLQAYCLVKFFGRVALIRKMFQNGPMTIQMVRGVIPELTLGQRLTVAMEYAGLTVADMARVIGRGDTTIRAYIRMSKPISPGHILAWAVTCGVDPTWLRTGRPGPEDPGPGHDVAGPGFEPGTSGLQVLGVARVMRLSSAA